MSVWLLHCSSSEHLSYLLLDPLQLEQTVQKLQMALGFSDEEVGGLPSPQVRIKELEEELEPVNVLYKVGQTHTNLGGLFGITAAILSASKNVRATR